MKIAERAAKELTASKSSGEMVGEGISQEVTDVDLLITVNTSHHDTQSVQRNTVTSPSMEETT